MRVCDPVVRARRVRRRRAHRCEPEDLSLPVAAAAGCLVIGAKLIGDGIAAPGLHSFPSGHAALCVAVYGFLAYLWIRSSRSAWASVESTKWGSSAPSSRPSNSSRSGPQSRILVPPCI